MAEQQEPSQEDLHVWTDGHDSFVATDRDHLKKVFKAYYGESMEYVIGVDKPIQHWTKVPDEEEIVIHFREIEISTRSAFDMPEDAEILTPIRVEASAKAWAKHKGPGLLCSDNLNF